MELTEQFQTPIVDRFRKNGVAQEVVTAIFTQIHRVDGQPVFCLSLPDSSEITIFRGRERTPGNGHVHAFSEQRSAAGKSKTHIRFMVEDVHTFLCACGKKVTVSYTAPY